MGLHRDEVLADGLHAAVAVSYPTAADRLADSNRTPADHPLAVGHLVEQVDTGDLYRCTGLGPPTFKQVSASGAASFSELITEPLVGYLETTPAGAALPTTLTWWDSAAKNRRLLGTNITYSGALPVTLVYQFYDEAGAPSSSITETRTYIGGAVNTITRV